MTNSTRSQNLVPTRMRLWVNSLKKSKHNPPSGSSSSTSSVSTLGPSLFFSLPGEIRNLIYHFVLYSEHVSLIAVYYHSPRDMRSSLLQSPIFRLSRQIRSEALSFLCLSKKFRIYGVQSAATFFRSIGHLGVANLTNITLALSEARIDTAADQLFEGLKAAKVLKYLNLIVLRVIQADRDQAWSFFRKLMKVIDEMDGVDFKWSVVLKTGTVRHVEMVRVMMWNLADVLREENWDLKRAEEGKAVWKVETV